MIAVDEKEEEGEGNHNLTFYSAMLGMKRKNTTIPTFLTSKSTSFYWQILDPWPAWYWYGTWYYIYNILSSHGNTETVCTASGLIRSEISSNR